MAYQAIGDAVVGSSVYLNVNGTKTEFLVVHQGKPSSLYDDSCNGTWLLMKDIYEKKSWDAGTGNVYSNDYTTSSIHAYLNGTFWEMLDGSVQSAVKVVKIPHHKGKGDSTVKVPTIVTGADGLPTKIFLLGAYEIGWTTSTNAKIPEDGACLAYFEGISDTDGKRIAKLDGTDTTWWLRSTYAGNAYNAHAVLDTGEWTNVQCTWLRGIRPALVLSPAAMIDTDTSEVYVDQNGGHVALVDGTACQIEGGTVLLGGIAYEIESGQVLSGGMLYKIALAKAETVTITISGSPSSSYAYATINGTRVATAGIYEYEGMPTISVCVDAASSGMQNGCSIKLNGTTVQSGAGVYTLGTDAKNITITMTLTEEDRCGSAEIITT